ncbi:carbon monoxide dehydrogenase subunit G [Pigmentiphaga sp.]|uniref:SRPBCC family protein n=1 Tax=Pigmentiphaga sp. TaxID=1977564 RepID=UPI0025DA1208|nr:carbon monoxide dehydrogenase subunit G [Pigmentiphaga sp.]
MDITGTQVIAAPRSEVWRALNDPDTLKRCLPGCESVEQAAPDAFRIVITAAVGPLRPRFNGSLRLTDAVPPASCVMVFEGQGGAMGFGKGSASVELREVEGGTELAYAAKAQVGGKLAQVGARLIDSVARKISDDFFKAFRKQFLPEAPAVRADGEGAGQTLPRGEAARPDSNPTQRAPAAIVPQAADADAVTRVPGWWLIVAFVLGVAATLAGAVVIP